MPEESIIKLKRADVSGKVPALSSLELGELALNTTDGKIFFKNSNNEILTFLNDDYYTEVTTLVRSNSAVWESPQIGVVLTSDPIKFVFIGNGSTTSYSVSGTAASTNAALVEVFIDNVRQEPTESYSLSANIVEFTQAPSLSSRIVVITPNTVAGQLSVAKRHEFIDEDTYSISYAAIAAFGTPENSPFWRITKITYTDFGSVSATQYANDVEWTDRLTVSYS